MSFTHLSSHHRNQRQSTLTTIATSDNEPLWIRPMMRSSNGSYNSKRTWQTSAAERSNYGQPTRQRVPLPRPTYARCYAIPLPAHPPQDEQRLTYHSTESCQSMNDGQKMQLNTTKISQQPEPSPHRSRLTFKPCINSFRRQERHLLCEWPVVFL
jgi:hypothetical protein